MTFKQTFSLIGPLVSSILRARLAESMASPVIKRTLLGSLASTTMLSSGLVFGAAGDAVFYKVDGSGTNVIDITCTNNRFYDLPPCFFEIKVEIFDPDGLSNFSPDTDGGTSYLPSAPQDSFASFQNAAPWRKPSKLQKQVALVREDEHLKLLFDEYSRLNHS